MFHAPEKKGKMDMTEVSEEKIIDEELTEEKGSAKKKNKKNGKAAGRKKRTGLVVFLCVLLVIALLMGYTVMNYRQVLGWMGINDDFSDTAVSNEKFGMLTVKENLYNEINTDVLLGNMDYINILLFGLDEDEARHEEYEIFRPDTIMLISVNFKKGTIGIVSVPRDSYVDIYTAGGRDKINTCFLYGYYLDENADPEQEFLNGVKVLRGDRKSVV